MGFVRDAELLLAVLMLTNNAAAGSNTTNFSVLPRTAARYSSTALCRTHGETCSSGPLVPFDDSLVLHGANCTVPA